MTNQEKKLYVKTLNTFIANGISREDARRLAAMALETKRQLKSDPT